MIKTTTKKTNTHTKQKNDKLCDTTKKKQIKEALLAKPKLVR